MTRFAILGFGFMGKKHYEVINSNPNTTVSAIIDKQAILHPETESFQSLDLFLEKKRDVDVVIIATPNSDHYSSAKKLLENGYNVFLEKPYCLTLEESEKLQHISSQNGTKIFFSRQNRYAQVSKFLKKLIDEKTLGDIYMVQTNLFWSRNQNYYQPDSWKGKKTTDGGTLYTQFFHFIDLILWIFGDIEIKSAFAKTLKHKNYIEIEDTGTVTFELKESEGIGVLNFSTAVFDKNLESSMTIIAEKGSVKISGQYFDEIEYCNIENFSKENIGLKTSDNLSNLSENLNSINEDYNLDQVKQNFDTVKKIEEIYKMLN